MMVKFWQVDFAALKRTADGYIHLPAGDWSGVDFGGADQLHIAAGSILGDECHLGDGCVLGEDCILGDFCELGNNCVLGDRCTLGYRCMLGSDCILGDGCSLYDGCELGDGCKLGNDCILGDGCILGRQCELGNECELGNRCTLGDGCSMEGGRVQNAAYAIVTNIGSHNDSACAYCNTQTGDIYVRVGCWFGSLDDFIVRVEYVLAYYPPEQPYIEDYRAFVEFARARFAKYNSQRIRVAA